METYELITTITVEELARILPTRNGNYISILMLSPPFAARILPTRNGNGVHTPFGAHPDLDCTDPTYKEWKRESFLYKSSVPLSAHGSYLQGMETECEIFQLYPS